ncbi:hypothetical protein TARUN_8900 [Trichoderma arundinaceum]|uniref:Uncharacterized protein n=1 Tax=Trichoderma arundinaceum TaxID=490622 RepID=A0A395NBP6_TRIAR|nr:hypothetical protein TARUN_8900 [Trichoderma arundinaceum]
MSRRTYSAQTPADLQQLSTKEGQKVVLAQLGKSLGRSASRWSSSYLGPARLLMSEETAFLSTFATHHGQSCPVCNPDKPSKLKLDRNMVDCLLREDVDLLAKQADLLARPGGYFWAALSEACRSGYSGQTRSQPGRDRRPPPRPKDCVDSAAAIQGSSSPVRASSSEGFHTDIQDVDDDENDERRHLPEDISLQLLHNFTRYFLQGCIVQEDKYKEICTRVKRMRYVAQIAAYDVTGWDDGGVASFRRLSTGWEMDHPFYALFEAKKTSAQLREDPQTGNMSPVVSDAILAQCFAEAVLAWRANPKQLHQEFSLSPLMQLAIGLRR